MQLRNAKQNLINDLFILKTNILIFFMLKDMLLENGTICLLSF